jgi:FkbM family methyltransferase
MGSVARKVPDFKGKSRIARSLAKVLLGKNAQGRIHVSLPDGSRMSLDPRSRTEAGAFYSGVYDRDDIDFFKCCLSDNPVTLDIGANVGLISIPLSLHSKPRGQLIAFEPVAANARALRENIELNGLGQMVEICECALGNEKGTLRIGRETATGASTDNAYTEASATGLSRSLEWTSVPVKRLDDVIESFSPTQIDLIKMDVEGAELDVLRGSLQTLQKYRPIIYGEFNLALRSSSGETFADVAQIMGGLDYQCLAFKARLQLVPVAYEAGRGNVVLCPNEKLEALLDRTS